MFFSVFISFSDKISPYEKRKKKRWLPDTQESYFTNLVISGEREYLLKIVLTEVARSNHTCLVLVRLTSELITVTTAVEFCTFRSE